MYCKARRVRNLAREPASVRSGSPLARVATLPLQVEQIFARGCGLRIARSADDVNVLRGGGKSSGCRFDRDIPETGRYDMRSRAQGFGSLHASWQRPGRGRERSICRGAGFHGSYADDLTIDQNVDLLAPRDEHVGASQRYEVPRRARRRRIGHFEHATVNRRRRSRRTLARHEQECRHAHCGQVKPGTHRVHPVPQSCSHAALATIVSQPYRHRRSISFWMRRGAKPGLGKWQGRFG
jgi:hypothetical protein